MSECGDISETGFALDQRKLQSENGLAPVCVRDLSRTQLGWKLLSCKEIAEEVWLGVRDGIRNYLITAA